MDKAIKAFQLLTLNLVSLVCVAYIWRQYYDHKIRQEAWGIFTNGRTTKQKLYQKAKQR
jgi:hypothetical protein